MKAVRVDRPQDPATLTAVETDVPEPADGEVLVRVSAAAVNRSDALACRGVLPGPFPRTLGRDFAGTVVGGTGRPDGERVWGTGGSDLGLGRDGSHAEYVLLPSDAVTAIPDGWSLRDAGASGLSYFTAATALERAGGVSPDTTVVCTGAAGAVGAATVAIAHARGAAVIAIVRDRVSVERLPPFATALVSSEATFRAQLAEAATGATRLVDAVGGGLLSEILSVLGVGAGVCILSAPPENRLAQIDTLEFYRREIRLSGLHTGKLPAQHAARVFAELASDFSCGRLPPTRVGSVHTLEDAATAYERAEFGSIGRPLFVLE